MSTDTTETPVREYPPGRGPRRPVAGAIWSLVGLTAIAGGAYFAFLGNGGTITEQAKSFAPGNAASGNDDGVEGQVGKTPEPAATTSNVPEPKPDIAVSVEGVEPGTISETISNMAAGDTQQVWFDVTNTTAGAIEGLTLKTSVAQPNSLSDVVVLSIDSCLEVPIKTASGSYICSNNSGVGTISKVSDGTLEMSGTLASQASKHLILSFRVPAESGNSVAGLATEITYSVNSGTIG